MGWPKRHGLVMAILLCHGESGSGVLFRGCVLAIVYIYIYFREATYLRGRYLLQ